MRASSRVVSSSSSIATCAPLFFLVSCWLVLSTSLTDRYYYYSVFVNGFSATSFAKKRRFSLQRQGQQHHARTTTTDPPLVVCFATPKKKKTKKTGSGGSGGGGGGGFGWTTTAPTTSSTSGRLKSTPPQQELQQDGDYSVFAKLEPRVLETLIPSTSLSSFAGELPLEIYDRLDQIYGFPNFNYYDTERSGATATSTTTTSTSAAATGTETTDESAASSFADMLSVVDDDNDSNDDNQEQSATTTATTTSSTSSNSDGDHDDHDDDLRMASSSSLMDLLPPFSKFRVLHVDPLVLAIDDFFTPDECDLYVSKSSLLQNNNENKDNKLPLVRQARQSPTVGKDAAAKAQRTSTTWYHSLSHVPELLAKASRLLGLHRDYISSDNDDTTTMSILSRWEEPQTVRYRRNEKFTWHLDALGPDLNVPELGGQRVATLLVYLTELDEKDGGATAFRDLLDQNNNMLKMRPRKGAALLFFPAAGGIPGTPFDIRTLHCGEIVSEKASNDKWIAQLWLRQSTYRPLTPNSLPSSGNHDDRVEAMKAIAKYCQNTSFR